MGHKGMPRPPTRFAYLGTTPRQCRHCHMRSAFSASGSFVYYFICRRERTMMLTGGDIFVSRVVHERLLMLIVCAHASVRAYTQPSSAFEVVSRLSFPMD
ncbi:hypothetical protein Tcan_10430 [Toxocara canis]|uniref:Uncharacterized protein n=1 Tax=Toxocara canis TaxID=6265 RepID=A0A0B2V2J1_TOXCA|nr:hypothetical protein Tcan_10430 [Toxocara canis]